MRFCQTTQQKRARDNLYLSIADVEKSFCPKSCQLLSKNAKFKGFLAFMAERTPDTMEPILKDTLVKMPRPTGCDLEGKRAAPDHVYRDEAREAKKAKLNSTRRFAEEAFRTPGGAQKARVVSRKASPTRPCVGNNDATPEPLFVEQLDEEENTKQDQEAGEETEGQGEEDEHGAEDEHGEPVESGFKEDFAKLEDYTAYQIEEGLTRGSATIQKLFASEFATIPRLSNGGYSSKDGSRILFACQKLQFEGVIDALKKFLRVPARICNPIPSSCDVNDPSQLLRILKAINGFIQEPKVHKAFTQMRLFTTINARAAAQEGSTYLDVLNQLVGEEFGAVSPEYAWDKVSEYRSDYHKGRRWLETAECFGGTAVVFIVIVTGIGAGNVDRDWTDYERSCLEFAISYLPSVKKIVACLGTNALEVYCRHGHLPEEKVKELEELEGTVQDQASEEEDPESDDDRGEGGDE